MPAASMISMQACPMSSGVSIVSAFEAASEIRIVLVAHPPQIVRLPFRQVPASSGWAVSRPVVGTPVDAAAMPHLRQAGRPPTSLATWLRTPSLPAANT